MAQQINSNNHDGQSIKKHNLNEKIVEEQIEIIAVMHKSYVTTNLQGILETDLSSITALLKSLH